MDICINGHLRLRLDSIGLMVYQPEFSIWTSMDRLSHRGIFVIDMMISTVNRYPLLSWLLNMDIYLEISHKWIFLIYIYSSFWMYIIHLPLQGIEGSVTASAFSWEWTHDHSIIHPLRSEFEEFVLLKIVSMKHKILFKGIRPILPLTANSPSVLQRI